MDAVDNVETGDNVEDLNGKNISENGNNLIDVEDENTSSAVNGRKRKKTSDIWKSFEEVSETDKMVQ